MSTIAVRRDAQKGHAARYPHVISCTMADALGPKGQALGNAVAMMVIIVIIAVIGALTWLILL